MTHDELNNLLKTYEEAWIKQDPELILSIFTEDAEYDDPHEPICHGHDEIREYWKSKVLGEQKDISFKLLNTWIEGNTAIAEWEAEFIDIKRNLKINMKEVAILGIRDSKFSSLREYYKTKKTQLA